MTPSRLGSAVTTIMGAQVLTRSLVSKRAATGAFSTFAAEPVVAHAYVIFYRSAISNGYDGGIKPTSQAGYPASNPTQFRAILSLNRSDHRHAESTFSPRFMACFSGSYTA